MNTAASGQSIWRDVSAMARSSTSGIRHFQVDHAALRRQLDLAPQETLGDRSQSIQLPMPDGSLQQFIIVKSSIMQSALAAKYPQIKTYKVFGVDDPTASGRVDITPLGFHAMLFTSKGRLVIDPEDASGLYQSRFRSRQSEQNFACGVQGMGPTLVDQFANLQRLTNRLPGNLLTYRLAVAATEEYVTEMGGTVAKAQAEIVTAINRVNAVYERDLGIRFLLVANNDDLIEQNGNACFSNGSPIDLLGENQEWIDSTIGSSSYDVGHVFNTGPGGVARIESACSAGIKAQGATGLTFPKGEIFYIDYVAHEIGHQLGAEHSFNGTTANCSFGRVGTSAFEPGSGSTIMGYAGICNQENLQPTSDATFHAGSINEIDAFTSAGGSCFLPLMTGNNDPTLTMVPDRIIPGETPFQLDNTTANDDEVVLWYQWDQMDIGSFTSASSFGQDLGDNPLFRSYEPQVVSYRDFPALGTQVLGKFDKAEVMASSNRILHFRLTVRDGVGGQAVDDVINVTVNTAAGPFRIISPNVAQTIDFNTGPATVTWDVSNTNDPGGVNCQTVDISLLTFDDANYTNYSVHPLLGATNNDGTASIAPITMSHPRARLRVSCSNNIFYDISNADLNIVGTDPTALPFSDTDNKTFFNEEGDGLTLRSGFEPGNGMKLREADTSSELTAENTRLVNIFANQKVSTRDDDLECTIKESSSGSGSGSLSISWLLFLSTLIAGIKVSRRHKFVRACSRT